MSLIENITAYRDGPSGPYALVAELAEALEFETRTPIAEGEGWAVLRDNTHITWGESLDRPTRPRGSVTLTDPGSFGDYVTRLITPDTVIYGDRERGRFVAVFNDHPATQIDNGDAPGAGHRDHRAVLQLQTNPEWATWMERDNRLYAQADFAEFVEGMAHTIVRPTSGEMLEVAQTLTGKQQVDFGSRTRLDNGDIAFKFETETTMRAGRGPSEVEIPSSFVFEAPVWEGTPPVAVEARFRVRAGQEGVKMGYRLIRVADATMAAFLGVMGAIENIVGEDVPLYHGDADGSGIGRGHY